MIPRLLARKIPLAPWRPVLTLAMLGWPDALFDEVDELRRFLIDFEIKQRGPIGG